LFKEQGEKLLARFTADLEEYGKLEQAPMLEGKKMMIFISPKKGSSKKEKSEKTEKPQD
jgi:translation initiation factor IF-3